MLTVSEAWDAVLDDLEERLAAAEAGDLTRLSGWTPPAGIRPAPGADVARAASLVARQQALMSRLREERARTAAALGALRRRARTTPSALAPRPVYLDRLG